MKYAAETFSYMQNLLPTQGHGVLNKALEVKHFTDQGLSIAEHSMLISNAIPKLVLSFLLGRALLSQSLLCTHVRILRAHAVLRNGSTLPCAQPSSCEH